MLAFLHLQLVFPVKASPADIYEVPAASDSEKTNGGFVVCEVVTDTVVAFNDVGSLEDANREAFLAANEATEAVEGKAVVDFAWTFPEQYTFDAENYLEFGYT